MYANANKISISIILNITENKGKMIVSAYMCLHILYVDMFLSAI